MSIIRGNYVQVCSYLYRYCNSHCVELSLLYSTSTRVRKRDAMDPHTTQHNTTQHTQHHWHSETQASIFICFHFHSFIVVPPLPHDDLHPRYLGSRCTGEFKALVMKNSKLQAQAQTSTGYQLHCRMPVGGMTDRTVRMGRQGHRVGGAMGETDWDVDSRVWGLDR